MHHLYPSRTPQSLHHLTRLYQLFYLVSFLPRVDLAIFAALKKIECSIKSYLKIETHCCFYCYSVEEVFMAGLPNLAEIEVYLEGALALDHH